jgi:endoglucanase
MINFIKMNNISKSILLIVLILGSNLIYSCKKDTINTLTATPGQIEIDKDGGIASLSINTDADSWTIVNPAESWIVLSSTSGTQQKALIQVSVNTKTTAQRSAILTLNAGNAEPVEVEVVQAASEYIYSISANASEFTFSRSGELKNLTIITDAPTWTITSDYDWLEFEQTSGQAGTTINQITALENEGEDERTATFTISAEYAEDFQILVTQNGELYPSYNTNPIPPDASGMSSTAEQIAANIVLGWNNGNSLEAIGGETAWGNPTTSKALIQLVKESGFNAVRVPCSFNQYMKNGSTAELKDEWLDRVKQVVQYCIDEDMYVLLNIHWDGGWLENNCTTDKQEQNNAKQKAFWEQIATHLRDFDEHLLFASANEPNVENATQMEVLLSYHQTFVDAVRSTGGRNSYRTLVVQGPSTDIEKTYELMDVMPADNIPYRMMAEIHYYTPWNFCGLEADASWGNMFYFWGEDYHSSTNPERNATWGEEDMLNDLFLIMKNKFVDNGYPVILGEYSVLRRSNLTGQDLELHLASRAYYFYYATKQAKAHGLIPFYWDNGHTGVFGSAIFNRNNTSVFDQQALDALIEGANQ